MNITQTIMGVKNKEVILPKICSRYNVTSDEIACIGDDVNDIELLKLVGLSACPNDAENLVKNMVDYLCKIESGKGAFREFSSLILFNKFLHTTNWY